RPAIGIAGVVERVDADDDVPRLEHFRPAKRQPEEDGIAGRHIRDWNVRRPKIAVARDRYIGGQRGSADAAEIKIELEMFGDAERGRDAACRFSFAPVALTVTYRQRVKLVPLRPGDGSGGIRIEAAAQQKYGSHIKIGELVNSKFSEQDYHTFAPRHRHLFTSPTPQFSNSPTSKLPIVRPLVSWAT